MAGFDIAPYGQAIAEVGSLLNGILKRVLPEKMSELEKAQIQQSVTMELMKADWGAVAGQMEINKAEASSNSLFVAGWRPFVGWVCGAAMAYSFVLQPFLAFTVGVFKWSLPPLPVLDAGSLMTVLLGMLGLGGMRTFEKLKGVVGSGK
jgi:hypothetical protein